MKYNVLKDENYKNGFMLKGLNSIKDGHDSKKDIIFNNSSKLYWYICQWNSKYNFIEDGIITHYKNHFELQDFSKKLTIEGSKIYFSLDASKEYDHPRKENEPWPHLLLEQNIEPNCKLNKLKSLSINGTFELEEFENYMDNSQNNIHTSQFVVVLVAKNINANSKDFNRFIWIVCSIYDSRYSHSPLYCSQDKALPNGEWIYSFCSNEYMENLLELKKPQDIHFEIYQRMEEILSLAKENGFLVNTTMDDLALTGMNLGLEITGTYKTTISVKDLKILVEEK